MNTKKFKTIFTSIEEYGKYLLENYESIGSADLYSYFVHSRNGYYGDELKILVPTKNVSFNFLDSNISNCFLKDEIGDFSLKENKYLFSLIKDKYFLGRKECKIKKGKVYYRYKFTSISVKEVSIDYTIGKKMRYSLGVYSSFSGQEVPPEIYLPEDSPAHASFLKCLANELENRDFYLKEYDNEIKKDTNNLKILNDVAKDFSAEDKLLLLINS